MKLYSGQECDSCLYLPVVLESNLSAPSKGSPIPTPLLLPCSQGLVEDKTQRGHMVPTLCHPACSPFSSSQALVSLLPPYLCLYYCVSFAFSCPS